MPRRFLVRVNGVSVSSLHTSIYPSILSSPYSFFLSFFCSLSYISESAFANTRRSRRKHLTFGGLGEYVPGPALERSTCFSERDRWLVLKGYVFISETIQVHSRLLLFIVIPKLEDLCLSPELYKDRLMYFLISPVSSWRLDSSLYRIIVLTDITDIVLTDIIIVLTDITSTLALVSPK